MQARPRVQAGVCASFSACFALYGRKACWLGEGGGAGAIGGMRQGLRAVSMRARALRSQ